MAVAPVFFDARHQWFLQRILFAWWLAGRPNVTVTSWFRDRATNERVGGVPNSWHLDGLALDLQGAAAMVEPARSVGLEVIVEGAHEHFEPPWPRSLSV